MQNSKAVVILLGTALAVLAGCHTTPRTRPNDPRPHVTARVSLAPMSGHAARGEAIFTQDDDSTRMEASFSGLSPGLHRVHVHERGSCGTSGSTSGGAYDTLGSVRAGTEGKGTLILDDPAIYLSGSPSIIGRTVVLHSNSGDESAIIACGVITR